MSEAMRFTHLNQHWLALLFFIQMSALSGARADSPSFRIDRWKTEDGLPQNTVQSLYQSRDGYLWAGTLFGLARYDGVRFTVFDQANTPAMAATTDNCTSLAEDLYEDVLWVGTTKGLLRYREGKFEYFKRRDGLVHQSVLALAASRRGGIWIGTHGGLGRYHAGRFESFEASEVAGNIHCLVEDPQTNLWAGTGNAVVQMRPSGEIITHQNRGRDALALYHDPRGVLWIGYKHTGALYALSNGVTHSFPLPPLRPGFSPYRSITSIFQDSSENLWVNVSNDGLHVMRAGELVAFKCPQDLPIVSTRRGMEDAEGNLWFGTSTEGLFRLQPRRLATYALGDGTGRDIIWSIAESKRGAIWLGTDDGVLCLTNEQLAEVPFSGASQPAAVQSIFVDADDQVWAGRAGSGAWKLEGSNFVRKFTRDGAPGLWDVHAIYQQRDGRLWFGSGQGLWLWASNRLTRFEVESGLVHSDVRGLLEDSQNNLWIATYHGLSCLSNGVFRNYTTKNGLSHNQVYFLHEDRKGALWVGTQLGLTRVKNGAFTVFTTSHGLFDNLVNQLFEDKQGGFWIGCNRGIYRVRRADLEAIAEGTASAVHCLIYGEADGMLSSETNGEHQPAGCHASDGRLWFPTMKGAVVIDPERVYRNLQPPPVIIEEVAIDEEPFLSNRPIAGPAPSFADRKDPSGAVALPAGRARSLQISYTANSLVDPEKVRFRYRLEGHDSKWHDAGKRRMALYTNLRPGKYTFRVSACNNHGYWNEAGASFAFTLAPHFYQTWTFYLVSALGIGAAGFAIHRRRLRLARSIQELEASIRLSDERARIAKDMHDDIGANLTRIGLLNEVARNTLEDPQRARAELNKVAVIAGETIASLSELVWATNSNYDTIENTVVYLREYIARFFEPTDTRPVLKFPSELPALRLNFTFRRHLLLIFK